MSGEAVGADGGTKFNSVQEQIQTSRDGTMAHEVNSIRYRDNLTGIAEEHLGGFFVGWRRPSTPAKHLDILRGSSAIMLAWDQETQRVVGFINALTDGHLCAFIPLLEVLPEFRGRGIGSELVRRLLARLDGYYAVDVVCDEDVIPFYQRFGFFAGRSMMRRNY